MNLIKRKNNWVFDPFREFEDFFGASLPRLFGDDHGPFAGTWLPAIDVDDAVDKLVVKAELPGMDKKNVQVAINGDILSIRGEKRKDDQIKGKNYYRNERYFGSFQRHIRLGDAIDTGKIKSSFKDGVLELILPKKEPSKEKRIDIE